MGIRQNIIKLRDLFNLTQEELASIAGVSRGAVSQWEGGFSEPRMGAIQNMADHFGIAKSNIIEEDGMANIDPVTKRPRTYKRTEVYASGEATVPLATVGKVHAGYLADEEEAERRLDIPASVLARHPHAQALVVEGTCMNKVVPEGLAVVYDPDIEPTNGRIAIVETEDYQALMRRWYRGGSTLMLVADSYEEWDDIVLKEDECSIKVIGTVVWVQSVTEL